MERQSVFSEKNKKTIINLSTAEFAHRVVKVMSVMVLHLNQQWSRIG